MYQIVSLISCSCQFFVRMEDIREKKTLLWPLSFIKSGVVEALAWYIPLVFGSLTFSIRNQIEELCSLHSNISYCMET